MKWMARVLLPVLILFLPTLGLASSREVLHLTSSPLAITALCFFIIAYGFVIGEEFILLRKSKPVVFAAGLIWIIVALAASRVDPHIADDAIRHNLLEYTELFLFLLVAMTYINALEERNVFQALRSYLLRRRFSYRQLFWITGLLTFFMSPIADNLTTALLMGAVIVAVGGNNTRFVATACSNVVIAANAGGAFSPFGDITTLMVWQKGIIPFHGFYHIFVPALVSYLVPAFFMYFAIPKSKPEVHEEATPMKYGARRIILLFLITITLTITLYHWLYLPPVIGMMTGLSLLMIFSFHLKNYELKMHPKHPDFHPFDIFNRIKSVEWDTLFFFYGVIMCVGGLAMLGYLELLSNQMYQTWGANLPVAHQATPANIAVGLLSAIIDNIPVMYAILTMEPSMSEGQWLLVTLTTGIGGSLLSVGSAAGVALMGQTKGKYTFFGHLRWSWAITAGYAAAIITHLCLNSRLF